MSEQLAEIRFKAVDSGEQPIFSYESATGEWYTKIFIDGRLLLNTEDGVIDVRATLKELQAKVAALEARNIGNS